MNSVQSTQQLIIEAGVAQFESDPQKGRDFREISSHPNDAELLFVECSRELEPTGDCYVLRYNLTTKQLQRYVLPIGYFYTSARFSPQGNFVLMSRVPRTDDNKDSDDTVRQAYTRSEIVLMKTDGTDFRVLPLGDGNKVAPVMSQDETRVAYWRSSLRQPGSKTLASKYDVWEVSLKEGQDTMFAGPFAFFERAKLQYLSADEMLVGAYGPREYAQSMLQYDKKYNRSHVYRIKRGIATLPEPILAEVTGANLPSIDKTGSLYFAGERPGLSLFRKAVHGQIEQWQWPVRYSPGEWGGGLHDLVTDLNGGYLAFVYEIKGTLSRDQKRGIGLLITQTSEWRSLIIPPLRSSAQITVRNPN